MIKEFCVFTVKLFNKICMEIQLSSSTLALDGFEILEVWRLFFCGKSVLSCFKVSQLEQLYVRLLHDFNCFEFLSVMNMFNSIRPAMTMLCTVKGEIKS